MLDIEFIIKNYRCFGDEPTRFRVQDGFTALVGTNNSGKSSLLRFLYEFRPLLGQLQQKDQSVRAGLRGEQQWTWGPSILQGERIIRATSSQPMELQIIVRDGPSGQFSHNGEQLILVTQYGHQGVGSAPEVRLEKSGLTLKGSDVPEMMTDEFFEPLVAAMGVLTNTMYIGPFRNAIHVGGQSTYYDIQTGDAFVSSFSNYKSGNDPAANEAVYEMTEELRRIFGFEKLEINPSGQTLQLMIDGRSYRLSEQGAGFAHFVVVMVNVLVRRPKLLLIDEPELNLHASLQLDFLQTLARYTEHGVIFATHSLGLARTAADQIYTLAKPAGGTSTLKSYEDNQDLVTLLGQLSFDHRPDLGFSKVLLVEGKTELRALSQLLRVYGKEHEVLMLPLHGASLIRPDSDQELANMLRIGGAVHYLIDSERDVADGPLEASRQGFVDLCGRLGIAGHVLERRALENYFSDEAVKRVFGSSARALAAHEKKEKSSNQAWRKTDNWRVALKMSRADLDGTDLGTFLENL